MAGKNNVAFALRASEDMLRRLIYIAEAEHRTPNNHLLHLLRQNIAYFERTHGKITQADLQKIDISLEKNQGGDAG